MLNSMKSGVYAIINNTSGDCYVGSSSNIKRRFKAHIRALNRGTHHSWELQRVVDKFGIDNFSFRVLEFCTYDLLLMYEQYYIDSLHPIYNISRVAGSIPLLTGKKVKSDNNQLTLW